MAELEGDKTADWYTWQAWKLKGKDLTTWISADEKEQVFAVFVVVTNCSQC